jgi:DNA-binding transcriptional LysR family regulator
MRPSPVTLQNLRYALAAADHGSFRRAAQALGVRQSTLSRCVHQLEGTVGITIFDRLSGGVRATHSGKSFLRGSRAVLEQLETLVAGARGIGRGEFGRIGIGFYTSLYAGNFRASLVEFRQRCPDVQIEMIEKSRSRLINALGNGSVDIAIVIGAGQLPECITVPLWTERLIVAVLETHRLASKEAVYWADLKGERLLLSRRDPGPELQELIFGKLASAGDRPNIQLHDVSRGSLWNLVGAGFGITLLTEATVGTNFVEVVYKELRDVTEATRISYSAHWRPENDNPALKSFLNLLSERYPLPPAVT